MTGVQTCALPIYGLPDLINEKTPSGKDEWNLQLKPLPKIVKNIKPIDPKIYLIGFKAEYTLSDEELIERAYKRMKETGMDLIVANDVSRENTGFGTDTNEVFIIDKEKNVEHITLTSKYDVASKIIDIFLVKS